MRTIKLYGLAVVIILVVIGLMTSQALCAVTLYEDFEGYYDPWKWPRGQIAREIQSGALASELYGPTPEWGVLQNQTRFLNHETIRSIQTTVNVGSIGLWPGYETNEVAAQVEGYFYEGPNGGIYAAVSIGDRGQGLEAWWTVREPQADGSTTSYGGTLVAYNDSSKLTTGNPYVASIVYNGSNGFTFTVDGRGDFHTGPALSGPPATSDFKSLTTGIWGNNDEGGGSIQATFDDVMVDIGSGFVTHDQFSTTPMDETKWDNLEEVRLREDLGAGTVKFRSDRRMVNGNRSANSPLGYNNTPYLEAKATFSSASQFTGTNMKGKVRVWGYYYNVRRGPGSGQPYDGRDGDAFVQLALRTYNNSGTPALRAEADVSISDANETTYASRYYQLFSKTVSFDTEYLLSIEFTGTSLIFTVADSDGSNPETHTYDISADDPVLYDPSEPMRHVSSRAYASGGEDIYVRGYIDDVQVKTSSISGTVVDDLNNPMASVPVSYYVDSTDFYTETTTDASGDFQLDSLPMGGGELGVGPDVSTGLAWDSRNYFLAADEVKDVGTIRLEKGALITGNLSDYAGGTSNPLSQFELWYGEKFELGWTETNASGYFEFRLPVGSYRLNLEDVGEWTMVPVDIDVTDVNATINLNNIPPARPPNRYAYTWADADYIEGDVTGLTGSPPGELMAITFMNDQTFNPEEAGGISPLGANFVYPTGPDTGYYLLIVPPTADYDRNSRSVMVMLALMNDGPDSTETITILDTVSDQNTPISAVDLAYPTGGQIVQGYVKDGPTKQGVYHSTVLLYEQPGDQFAGFAETDHNGLYVFYEVPAGTYRIAVTAKGYQYTQWSSSSNFDVGSTNYTVPNIFFSNLIVGLGTYPSDGGWVETLDDSWPNISWTDYNTSNGETRIATGDIDGDGKDEIIIGLGPVAGNPSVPEGWFKILDDDYSHLGWGHISWTAYNNINGESWPACGDVDGDGKDEIIVGLGTYTSDGGWLEVFDFEAGAASHKDWFHVTWTAYNSTNGEVRPACGDIDGDGRDEIIVGLGSYPADGGWLEVFDDASAGYAHLAWPRIGWSAYNAANGESWPACGDVDGDGKDEIIVGLGTYPADGGWLEIFDYEAGVSTHKAWLQVNWPAYNSANGETRPACGDVDSDGRDEIVVGLGQGGLGWLKLFDDTPTGYAHLAWPLIDWPAYCSGNGATWPAMKR